MTFTLNEFLMVLYPLLAVGIIVGLVLVICDLIEDIKAYEKPPKQVPPSKWNIPEDDWDERITKG